MRTQAMTAILIALIIGVVGVMMLQDKEIRVNTAELKNFNSYSELTAYVNNSVNYGGYYFGGRTTASGTGSASGAAMQEKAAGAAGSSSDFSGTNIQVEGVDEPDIVKNDGKYIYSVSGNKVIIVDAYPANSMNIVGEIGINKSIRNIFVNEDKLIIFSDNYNYYPLYDKAVDSGASAEIAADSKIGIMPIMPPQYSEPSSLVYVYDIGDRSKPVLKNEFSAPGNYLDARMIGDYVYLVSVKYIDVYYMRPPVFIVDGVERMVAANEIGYFDNPDTNYVFSSIMAINIDNGEYNSKVYLTGSASTIFVSENNVYLTNPKSIEHDDYTNRLINDVYIELLPFAERTLIKDILNSDMEAYKKLRNAQTVFGNYYNSLNGKEKEDFDARMMNALEEFQIEISKETEKTVIYKIEIDEEHIEYKTQGEVPGTLLNQFSMDENNGYFRIATTTGNSWQDTSLNHLYVLDKNLKVVGSVEDLAKGERIYSVRFMGDRAYMVTFKQVDPLFVIDLKIPSNPRVLGYLKVTGFSNYLHPYDENHIIGVGREASEEGRAQGLKIALFDVTNVQNPKEISKYEVKQGWSDSNALYDHKAFLFNKEKSLLVIPVSHTEHIAGEYRYWQGAYVFKVNLNGISLRGEISHSENDTKNYYYGQDIQRSLYIGNVLYTISLSKLKANNLDNLESINSVKLPYEEPVYYTYGSAGVAVAATATM